MVRLQQKRLLQDGIKEEVSIPLWFDYNDLNLSSMEKFL